MGSDDDMGVPDETEQLIAPGGCYNQVLELTKLSLDSPHLTPAWSSSTSLPALPRSPR
jgi:hypothetical protein